MISIYFLISLLAISQLSSNLISGQRTFSNPAVTDPAPCSCNIQADNCEPNCCCDSDCSDGDLQVSPVCKSTRTTSSYLSSQEQSLQTWNCSNTTSAALYDYFPFVCVQLKQNEVIGQFYQTDNITSVKDSNSAADLTSLFANQYSELFQPAALTTPSTTTYSFGVPVRASASTILALPGNLVGSTCQNSVNVLFGVNRDVTCAPNADLCTNVNSVLTVLKGGDSTSTAPVRFFEKNFLSTSTPTRPLTTEYYFEDPNRFTIVDTNSITSTTGEVLDYCPQRHPLNRTQRYFSACPSSTSCNSNGYRTYSGCSFRDNFAYSAIPATLFTARSSYVDDGTNFGDFDSPSSVTPTTCSATNLRRVFYRFNYLSTDNTISSVDVYVLLQASASTTRVTIEWNDVATNPAINTTIPRGYLTGETLQFRRANTLSDVSTLIPSANGYCVDAKPKIIRYKQDTSSQCFVQLTQNTMRNCHTLKLNMYLYLNLFLAPASHVLSYPSANATQIQIRDDTQDSLDLDRVDVTRPRNRLTTDFISRTRLNDSTPTIYDTALNLPICFDVPSGVYIEFGYVRVPISRTLSYERIVSVRYNYTYSTWQFTCNAVSCPTSSTQKYLVTFQSAFVDYTNAALNLSDVTRSDLTSADNYIQHLLWLITPEYKGEPGYRNYTIAMILIFTAIAAVVIHILLFGVMCPF